MTEERVFLLPALGCERIRNVECLLRPTGDRKQPIAQLEGENQFDSDVKAIARPRRNVATVIITFK
jgi:hypothetical protein